MPETKSNPKDTIAFQGSPGAHSDMACREAYPYMYTMPCVSFEEVFDAVENGSAALGLIPIENSQAGRVAEIHNIIPHRKLYFVGEYFHKVAHHLMGIKDSTLEGIKTVYSHQQALMQCRQHIKELGIEYIPFSDTAAAAEHIAEAGDPTKAALASDLAAELNGLTILKENMQDSEGNKTLFIAISKEPIDPDKSDEQILTSMIFTTRNISAGLYKALGGFATNGVNILKLESYISDFSSGTAQFFITFEGHPDERNVQLAMEELGFFTQKVRMLGAYPADRLRYKS